MGIETEISWTDHTWNPWMGCIRVSEGCRNCYAEQLTKNRMGLKLWGPGNIRQRTSASNWRNPYTWNRQSPGRTFCASLADIFEDHPQANAWRSDMWQVVRDCQNLTWQILTKRPENIARFLPPDWGQGWGHVWLGTTVEDMRVAERANHLRAVPAAMRFLSCEPALGPMDDLNLAGIGWVIYGGESGPGFRHDNEAWVRGLRDNCRRSGTAYYFKQRAASRPGLRPVELDGEVLREFPVAVESGGLFG